MTIRELLQAFMDWLDSLVLETLAPAIGHYFEVLFWQINWLDAHIAAIPAVLVTYLYVLLKTATLFRSVTDHRRRYRTDENYKREHDEKVDRDKRATGWKPWSERTDLEKIKPHLWWLLPLAFILYNIINNWVHIWLYT